ncbi:MAG: hypothetical protein K2J55_07070, partial [Eubacterium sp.]|nr:hypothetical protein [Eubacterium sp.]
MAEEAKIKSSLFGYSKKAVDNALEKLAAENSNKIAELEAKLLQEQKNNAMLQMEIKMLQECNKDLEIKFNETESSIEAINTENAELKEVIKEQAQKVDEALSELEKAQSVISEKEIVIHSIKNEKDKLDEDYTGILNTFNSLKADITRSRIIIDEKDKQIEMLNSKLGKYQIRHNEIMKKSDEISRNIINSGSAFDKKISELRECTNQMKLLIAEAEYTFNETSMNVSNFITIASNEAEASAKEEKKASTTEIH